MAQTLLKAIRGRNSEFKILFIPGYANPFEESLP